MTEKKLTVISLGAGVQSSTMALMAAHGEIGPMPDCAIFADTGAEPDHIYEYLEYLRPLLPFPIYVVKHKEGLLNDIKDRLEKGDGRVGNAPFFTESENGGGMLRRSCTTEYKITPIRKKLRELLGLMPGQRGPKTPVVEQWIGISLDEIQRMKDNPDKWAKNRWPLIEKNMTRWHCLGWMQKHGYKLPQKSSCTFCPYHDDRSWSEMKRDDPKSFAQAVEIDRLLRSGNALGVNKKAEQKVYLHRSLKPLEEVDFSFWQNQCDMFNDPYSGGFNQECDGMCGV